MLPLLLNRFDEKEKIVSVNANCNRDFIQDLTKRENESILQPIFESRESKRLLHIHNKIPVDNPTLSVKKIKSQLRELKNQNNDSRKRKKALILQPICETSKSKRLFHLKGDFQKNKPNLSVIKIRSKPQETENKIVTYKESLKSRRWAEIYAINRVMKAAFDEKYLHFVEEKRKNGNSVAGETINA